MKKEETPDYKALLAELTLRSNLAFPTDPQEERWFDAGVDVTNENHDDFLERLYSALNIGQTEHPEIPSSKKSFKVDPSEKKEPDAAFMTEKLMQLSKEELIKELFSIHEQADRNYESGEVARRSLRFLMDYDYKQHLWEERKEKAYTMLYQSLTEGQSNQEGSFESLSPSDFQKNDSVTVGQKEAISKEAISSYKERLREKIEKQREGTYWLGASKEAALDMLLDILKTTE